MRDDAVAPVMSTVMLVVLTLVMGSVLLIFVLNFTTQASPPQFAWIKIESVVIREKGNRTYQIVNLVHRGGDALKVKDLSVFTSVNGDPLRYQLTSLPTYNAKGYNWVGGVFSKFSKDTRWSYGEKGNYSIAQNNCKIVEGDMIEVKVVGKQSGIVWCSTAIVRE